MGYLGLMKSRLVGNFRAIGFSLRIMLQARKKLAKTTSVIFVVLLLLPLVTALFITDPIMALTWLVCLFIYLPIIDAYAYAVVHGGG